MELFLDNDAVTAMDRAWATASGRQRLLLGVEMAWHLRQRDSPRALALAQELTEAFQTSTETPQTLQSLQARLDLATAEIRLLQGDIDKAQALVDAASHAFAELGDPIGLGDTYWLQTSICLDRGDSARVAESIDLAGKAYEQSADTVRQDCAAARRLVGASFREPAAAASELLARFPHDRDEPPSLAAWTSAARANVAGLTDDPGASIRHDLASYQASLDSGQVRSALVSVANAAESFSTLGDLDAALEWSELALVLARKTEWPSSIGFCLMQLGDVMRLLGRHEESSTYLRESLVMMATQTGSRNYGQGLGSLGQLSLDMGDYEAGLDYFTQLESYGKSLAEPDLVAKTWRGQASALFYLGRLQFAETKAVAALTLSQEQGHAEGQIQVLRILAQIHAQGRISPPEGHTPQTAALHFLGQAVKIASAVTGYELSPELLEEVGAAHAAAGDFEAAYQSSQAARAARTKSGHKAAQQRTLALKVRQQVEQARADSDHHRKIAATLKETSATLETLGVIGREITASLDVAAVFDALHRNVHHLLDATAFAVYLLQDNQQCLVTAFGIEAGVALPISRVPMNSPTAMSARCARERREVLIEVEAGVITDSWIPGTLPTLSMLYAPLIVGEHLLGVMTIQSPKAKAYGDRERSIFHTLCAYGAIALDNASAYAAAAQAQQRADQANAELRLTQAQLVQDIAERQRIDLELHELNTDLEARIEQRTREMRDTLSMLAESKQKLQGIVDTALDAVVRVDAEGTIVGWNTQAQTVFGWSAQEALGRALHETIIPHQHRAAHLHGMARFMATGVSTVIDQRIEISALHRSGHEFPIELAITRVTLEDATKFEFCSFIRDITQRKQAEEEIRASLEQQKELNQLKTRFVAMASHEFRTPLATILSSTDLLKHYFDRLPAAERGELFQSINLAVRRMTKMLEDILTIGKDEAEQTQFKPAALAIDVFCRELVEQVQAEQESSGSRRSEVNLAVEGEGLKGQFDEKLLRHIFENLLSNAAKYSPDGAQVDFKVVCGPESFVFTVADHGIGVPADDLPRLFESFHRASNVGNIAGTGLGLAIVKRSVELHEGTISVSSVLGEGTVFEVCLPRDVRAD